MTENCFLKALRREFSEYTPVWMMRQAGRYLPEYRALRAKAGSFMALCKTPKLACEVTLQPLKRFPLDAAILFSDILTIPDAMGLGLSFTEGEGPHFEKPVRDYSAIDALSVPEPETQLSYVMETVELIQSELNGRTPLIGFSGSPWTLACYMVEGGKSQNFHHIKKLLYQEPQTLKLLLNKLVQAVVLYLKAQIKAGVDAVMLFDTWGGILTQRDYLDFSLAFTSEIVKQLPAGIPVIIFTKNSGLCLEAMSETGCHAVGIDWTVDIKDARCRIGHRTAIQGNMDPAVLLSTPARIREEVAAILSDYGHFPGHIFNLGHGITPDIPVENVEVFIQAVHELSRKYHTPGSISSRT